VLAHDLVFGIALDALGARIPTHNGPIGIQSKNGVFLDRIDECAKLMVAVPRFLFAALR
jgi:hypothetical protein